ncbi:MAG TPA: thiamine-phosphate kinase [Candidatus Binataceae bacterium]|nr:thiamine-phosphate kinase [Candidatus Binataceae bacterium]
MRAVKRRASGPRPRAQARRGAAQPAGEFELIERLCARLPMSARTLTGPGDDAAIIARSRGAQLFTIDSMVEGVHFNLRWGTPEQLGARALTVNLSDIAAMGGAPAACVVNLAIRPGLPTRFFERMYAGLARAARAARVDVVGGNVTRAKQLAITIALLGDSPPRPLRRDCARAGDGIYVTGTLGDGAAGWRVLAGRLRARGAARAHLIGRYLAPTARLSAGAALARMRRGTAAIDVSDGLWQDLRHILERSGVGAEIDPRAIPISGAYRAVMRGDLSLALGGGEDYELLFCLRPTRADRKLSAMLGVRVTRIGQVVRGGGARFCGGGTPALAGWDQLRVEDL